jgi:preprotein translocase subunit Sec63
MTTITIDIPDASTKEVIAQLKKLGVKVRQSKLANLDKLTKEDYQKHFSNQAKANRNNLLKYL